MTSTTPSWRGLRLGVFFVVAAGVLFTSLFVVGTNQHAFRQKYELKLYLPNAQGLSPGAVIALSGLEVGRVTTIEFVDRDTTLALEVGLSIETRFQDRITDSSLATLRTVGILGDKFIDISLGGPGERPLAEGEEIPVRGTIDWAATFERGAGGLEDFLVLIRETSEAVSKINRGEGSLGILINDPAHAEQLGGLLAELRGIMSELRGGRGTVPRLIREPETLDRLDGILDRVDRIAAETEQGKGLLGRLIFDQDLAGRVDALVASSDSLVRAIRHEGSTGRLISDETLYEEVETTIGDLRQLLVDIKANPERYVRVSIF